MYTLILPSTFQCIASAAPRDPYVLEDSYERHDDGASEAEPKKDPEAEPNAAEPKKDSAAKLKKTRRLL